MPSQHTRAIAVDGGPHHISLPRSRTSFNSLPDELLIPIIKLVVDAAVVGGQAGQDLPRVYSGHLLPLTHVCRHWRNTALAYPRLWSDVSIDADTIQVQGVRRILEHGLQKSEAVPLDVYLKTFDAQGISLAYIFQVLPRIRKLVLRCVNVSLNHSDASDDASRQHATTLLEAPAPQLQLLNLSGDIVVPGNNFLCGNAPRFEELTLDFCSVDWIAAASWSFLGCLTMFASSHPKHRASTGSLSRMLKRMPSLHQQSWEIM